MPGSRHPAYDSEQLEDLDEQAVAYARQWVRAGIERRGRLRGDLICHCVPFADRMARRYRGRAEPLEDLEQVARLGLIKAIDRYDPGRGSFTAFAVVTICGELKRHFRDKTWGIHVTRRLQDLTLEVGHATVVLTHTLARTPTTAELGAYLHITEQEVRHARECAAVHRPLSLSMPIDDDGARELTDLIGHHDESMETLPDKVTVAELIHALPARVQHMLVRRFYGNLTQAQIAAEFGISQMHVSRLLRQALTWLRAALLSDVVPPWAGVEECLGTDNLHARTTRTGTEVTVEVIGEIDRDNANRLRLRLHSAIAMAPLERLIIDIRRMPLTDAAGAAVLRDACLTAALAHVTVAFAGVQPHVAPVLAAVGLPI
jgi:RNA polymerase sigma-B factor